MCRHAFRQFCFKLTVLACAIKDVTSEKSVLLRTRSTLKFTHVTKTSGMIYVDPARKVFILDFMMSDEKFEVTHLIIF